MRRAQQPWLEVGLSRAHWYRLGRPRIRPERRKTQAELAYESGVCVRSFERAARIAREASDLAADVDTGRLTIGCERN
jgi:hypothetical protein